MAEKIVAIVGARLNSSRLPRKHLLPLAGKPLIERIFERLGRVPSLDVAVLATTADEYNNDLVSWASRAGVECYAHAGDVNDLMGRVDAVVKATGADIILYICGDCPLIEPETLEGLIQTLLEKPSSETVLLAPSQDNNASIHVGFDLFRRSFWDRMAGASETGFEKEHVASVWRHSGKTAPTDIAEYEDRPAFFHVRHRISVDTGQDYRFMRRVYDDWFRANEATSIVSLEWVVERLLAEPELAAINADVHQRKVDDVPHKVLLVCEVGPDTGLGHLARTCVAAFAMQAAFGASVTVAVRGEEIEFADLLLLPHQWIEDFAQLESLAAGHGAVVVDVKNVTSRLRGFLAGAHCPPVRIGIDADLTYPDMYDHFWMPSLYLPADAERRMGNKVAYGPDCFLLRGDGPGRKESKSRPQKILVLTGGADPRKLSHSLPAMLVDKLPKNTEIHWVKGTYSDAPRIERQYVDNGRWVTLDAPTDLPGLLPFYDAALCQFGVSFYECIKAGLPVATFDAIGAAMPEEWGAVAQYCPDSVFGNIGEAVTALTDWSVNGAPEVPGALRKQLMSGPKKFAVKVEELLGCQGGGLKHAS